MTDGVSVILFQNFHIDRKRVKKPIVTLANFQMLPPDQKGGEIMRKKNLWVYLEPER